MDLAGVILFGGSRRRQEHSRSAVRDAFAEDKWGVDGGLA